MRSANLEVPFSVSEYINLIVPYVVKVIGVVVVLYFGNVLSKFAARLASDALKRAKVDTTLTEFTGNLVRWALLIMVGLACLGAFGVQTTSFAALIGAAGLAIGLAFQGTLSSVAAGAMLLILRPFKIGDHIVVGGVEGIVVEIGLFVTALDTPSGVRVSLPNTAVFGQGLTNYSHNESRRVEVPVGTEYPADVERVREVLVAAAKTVENTNGEPHVILLSLGASSVDWQVRTFCNDEFYWGVWDATTTAAKKALDDAGIGIPYQTVDVNVDEDVLRRIAG